MMTNQSGYIYKTQAFFAGPESIALADDGRDSYGSQRLSRVRRRSTKAMRRMRLSLSKFV